MGAKLSSVKADSSPAIMSAGAQISNDQKPEEKKLSPCCVCKETKKERDTCIIENGEENCTSLIEAHKECMRKMGFNI